MTELAEDLASFLGECSGDRSVRVHRLRRSGEGSSRENWVFDADWSAGSAWPAELILRRDPAGGVVETSRRAEFELLVALRATSLPVPRVLWLDGTGRRLGRPAMVGERHRGRAHRGMFGPEDPLGLGRTRAGMAADLCDLLAAVHETDLSSSGIDGILARPDRPSAEQQLRLWTAELDRCELEPHPALRMVASWLERNVPPSSSPLVLVHGDFRPGNVLVDGNRVGHLLDWELARIGDRLDDLGWYCTPMYRDEHFIPGEWELADFLARYADRAGVDIDEDALRYWQIMAGFRLAVMGLTGMASFIEGRSNRPGRPVDAFAARLLASCP